MEFWLAYVMMETGEPIGSKKPTLEHANEHPVHVAFWDPDQRVCDARDGAMIFSGLFGGHLDIVRVTRDEMRPGPVPIASIVWSKSRGHDAKIIGWLR